MMSVVGRLRQGVTLEQAQQEMNAVAHRLGQTYVEDQDWGVTLATFYDWMIPREVRTGLYTLLASVAVVLLIAVLQRCEPDAGAGRASPSASWPCGLRSARAGFAWSGKCSPRVFSYRLRAGRWGCSSPRGVRRC